MNLTGPSVEARNVQSGPTFASAVRIGTNSAIGTRRKRKSAVGLSGHQSAQPTTTRAPNLGKGTTEGKAILGNALDSNPSRKRGKERENGKKRPTTLKKAIIKERTTAAQTSEQIQNLQTSGLAVAESDPETRITLESQEAAVDGIENQLQQLSVVDDIRSGSLLDTNDLVKQCLHSRNFREYCDHALTTEIDQATSALLADLVRFQDRLHEKNPMKAKIKRRLAFGLKEVLKYANLGKVKCLIVAPNIAKTVVNGILDRTIEELKSACKRHNTPVVFALSRFRLKVACKKPGLISCVAIFNYEGAQANFEELMSHVTSARHTYEEVVEIVEELLSKKSEDQLKQLMEDSVKGIPVEFLKYHNILIDSERKLFVARNPSTCT